MSFIGIDLGTSFIKGAVLNLDTRRIDHIRRLPFPDPVPGLPPLHREFDPRQIVAAVRTLLDDLAPMAEPCEGVVLCSQMHGLVLASADGQALSNLTTWQDQRELMPHPSGQGTYFDVMMERISAEQRQQLGRELRVGLPVNVLFWLAEQNRLPRGGAGDVFPLALPDFVLANLCSTVPVTEATNAHSHGLFNLETLSWHHAVIEQLGLGGLRWPEIHAQGQVVGWLRLGASRVPCYAPVGDFQCALTGALLRYGELSINISTGSQVSLLRPQLELGEFQTRPFFDGRFVITVTTIPAGRSLNALIRLLSELAQAQGLKLDDPWPYIAQAAAEVTLPRMRANLAFFNSAVGDHGELTNIREDELTVGHVFRAAFQNMAENYLACALRLDRNQGWSNLVFSGGLAQKIAVLRSLISQSFHKPYRLCPTSEDTMLGLMALGMAFTGRAKSVEAAVSALHDAEFSA